MKRGLISLSFLLGCAPVRVTEMPVGEGSDAATDDPQSAEEPRDDEAGSRPDPAIIDLTEAGGLLDPGPPKADWTVMVFINGDNDLESAALEDVNEMEVVGSSEEVHVLVQIDRSAGFDRTDGDWRGARRLRVEADDDQRAISSPVLEDLGATDSGSPEAVIEFVRWAAERYPAERYALVLWDHGWGWSFAPNMRPVVTKGISSDYASGNDISIAEGELAEILDGAVQATGQPLSIMGFDACLMASWEVAYATAPYAEVFVGSQDYESTDGWSYDATLRDLVDAPQMSPAELGEAIALRFSETRDSTQSVVDLSALAQLDVQLDLVAEAVLASEVAPGELYSVSGAALDFDGGWGTDHDLGDLLDRLAEATSDAEVAEVAMDARVALDAVVIANYTVGRGVEDAHGLSIYSPARGSLDELYFEGIWSEETLWDDLLEGSRPSR